MRDPIWTFIFGIIATVLALASLIVAIVALPQAAPLRNNIAQKLSGTPASTDTPAPTPISTPRPTPTSTPIPSRVLTENLTIKCNNDLTCGLEPNLSVVLDTIAIDFSNHAMYWKFTITPGKNESVANFSKLQLQDIDNPVPSTFKATGPATDQLWNLSAGQSTDMIAVFKFIPQPRTKYRLQTIYNTFDFQDEFFTF